MGADGLHYFLEGGSRDCVCFSQSSAGARATDPAEDVLLDVKEDAAADALCVSWFREGLADSHHRREYSAGAGAWADTEAVVYTKVDVHSDGESLKLLSRLNGICWELCLAGCELLCLGDSELASGFGCSYSLCLASWLRSCCVNVRR